MISARTLLVAAILLVVRPLHAQTLTIYGTADDPAIGTLLTTVERGSYQVLDRDTTLSPNADIASDVVIVAARIALEGRIRGSVVVVDGDLFVRPGATIEGRIATVGSGEVYPSGVASLGPVIRMDPRVFASVGRSPDGYSIAITGPPEPPVLRFPGLYGFVAPTYDRVNGLSIYWGTTAGFGRQDTARVAVSGTVGYRTLRERFDGQLAGTFRPTRRSEITVRGARGTRTNETWIRGEPANSLAAFFRGSDVRDYFDSQELALTVARSRPQPLIEGERFIAPRVTARVSRDRSVAAGDPWSLIDGDWRPNPPIDEGVLASLVIGATTGWRGATAAFDGAFAVEWAPGGIGDFEFAQLSANARWTMDSLWRHRIGVNGYALLPVGSNEAPLQRWSFVGGAGTLPTFPVAYLRGDHVLYLNSVYVAPIRRLEVPIVGSPALRLEHAAGTAWRTGDLRPPIEQNLAIGLQLLTFRAMLVVDPADGLDSTELYFGAQLSGGVDLPLF